MNTPVWRQLGLAFWFAMATAHNASGAVVAHAEAGTGTTCVVSNTGAPSCFGESVGDGSFSSAHKSAVITPTIGPIKAIALSKFNNFACVINSDNAIWCWSSDGIRVPFRLQVVSNLPFLNVSDISVGASGAITGDQDACAVLENGTVACWQFEASGFNALNPSLVLGQDDQPIRSITQVSVGYGFGCAVTVDNAVLCWGLNDAGQLGRGFVTPNRSLFSAVSITGLTASMVSAGLNHACAVTTDGKVKCWGADEFGQLGNGQSNTATNFPFSTPQSVLGISNAKTVSAGYQFTCATLADVSVKCWGKNDYGKIARPLPAKGSRHGVTFSSTPSEVNLGKNKLNYVVVSAGHDHACASGTYGGFHPSTNTETPLGLSVQCWGANLFGQLTNGFADDKAHPMP